jgi:hypothetical protein
MSMMAGTLPAVPQQSDTNHEAAKITEKPGQASLVFVLIASSW